MVREPRELGGTALATDPMASEGFDSHPHMILSNKGADIDANNRAEPG